MRGDKEPAEADHLGPCLRDVTELAELQNSKILTICESLTFAHLLWEEGGIQRG